MRAIQITYARLTATPTVSFDPATLAGEIAVTYVVGEVIAAVTNPDGSITGPIHREHPTCNTALGVAVPLGPADVAAERMAAMIQAICIQEGLDPTNGVDQVLGQDGSALTN